MFSTVAGSSGRHPIAIQWAGYRRPPFKGKCPINYCLPQIPSPVLQPLWQNVYPWWISQQTQTSKTQSFNNIMFSSYSEDIRINDEYLGLLPFFDFDGALNPFLHELCSLSTIYPTTSNCNSHELKTSTKVVGLLVPSRALPQHIMLSQLPKLSKYWNTVNTCTCKRWDFSSPLCLPLQTSCHRLAGITRATRTPPPSSSLSPSACSFHSWNYHSFVSWEFWCLQTHLSYLFHEYLWGIQCQSK